MKTAVPLDALVDQLREEGGINQELTPFGVVAVTAGFAAIVPARERPCFLSVATFSRIATSMSR